MQLGVELLALRATAKSNCAFGRLVRAAAIKMRSSDVSAAMLVARLYAGRSEIVDRLSWGALFRLSSPTTPLSVRQAIEARVITGEKIVASDPVRARDQPATRMAA